MIPRDGSIVLVDFAVAFLPVEMLAAANPEPCNDLLSWDFGSLVPIIDVIDNLVVGIRGNPASIWSSHVLYLAALAPGAARRRLHFLLDFGLKSNDFTVSGILLLGRLAGRLK